jgi:hypothetical protein
MGASTSHDREVNHSQLENRSALTGISRLFSGQRKTGSNEALRWECSLPAPSMRLTRITEEGTT